jgi:hypothetical protein
MGSQSEATTIYMQAVSDVTDSLDETIRIRATLSIRGILAPPLCCYVALPPTLILQDRLLLIIHVMRRGGLSTWIPGVFGAGDVAFAPEIR